MDDMDRMFTEEFRTTVARYSTDMMCPSETQQDSYVFFKDFVKIGLTQEVIDKNGRMRLGCQRPVNVPFATEIAEGINEQLSIDIQPKIQLLIGTIRYHEPVFMDGQHRFDGIWRAKEMCKGTMHGTSLDNVKVNIQIFDYLTEEERDHEFSVFNNKRLVHGLYISRADGEAEENKIAECTIVNLVTELYSLHMSDVEYKTEYQKFVSLTFNETELKEAVYDFVKKNRDESYFEEFMDKEIMKEMIEQNERAYEDLPSYYTELSTKKYPKGCMEITSKGEKCSRSCEGEKAHKFEEGYGLCGMHVGKLLHGRGKTTLSTCKRDLFKKRFERSGSDTWLLFKLGETEKNWLQRAFDLFLKSKPCICQETEFLSGKE
jgi:hypothetical protein